MRNKRNIPEEFRVKMVEDLQRSIIAYRKAQQFIETIENPETRHHLECVAYLAANKIGDKGDVLGFGYDDMEAMEKEAFAKYA